MKCVVPLAGPDLFSPEFGLRPLIDVDGQPLLRAALTRRVWAGELAAEDYIFVIRQVEQLPELQAFLEANWPGSRTVVLSHLTGGALFSVLSAMALIAPDEEIIVDLADILFDEGPSRPQDVLTAYEAVVPVFPSSEAVYSYLRSEGGLVVEAREKQVISDQASAGVYMFASPQIFLRAAAHSMDHREALNFRGILFICPMVNGVVAAGGRVAAPAIGNWDPVSKRFH